MWIVHYQFGTYILLVYSGKKKFSGLKHRDLFYCSINAGCTALPALLNIKQVMQQRQVTGIWSGKDELPVSTGARTCIYI